MKKINMLGIACFMLASNAIATNYTYNDTKIVVNFNKNNVVIKKCAVKNKCKTVSSNTKQLLQKLTTRIKTYQKLYDEKAKTIALLKKQLNSKKTQRIKDKASKKTYVMLSLDKAFNIPTPEKALKNGKFTFVFEALKANIDRFKNAKNILKSKKLPKSFKTKDYAKAYSVMELVNIVEYNKYL